MATGNPCCVFRRLEQPRARPELTLIQKVVMLRGIVEIGESVKNSASIFPAPRSFVLAYPGIDLAKVGFLVP